MQTYLAAFLMSLAAGLAIHLFFRVIRRYGPAGQPGENGKPYIPTAYLSVSDYVATRPRRRFYYLVFRHLPPLIVTLLLCGLLNKLFPDLWTFPYLLTATFSSVLFGSLREAVRPGIYLSERLVHIYNVAIINFMAVLVERSSHSPWLAAVTPSLEGIVDNIWSSLFVSLIVVGFIEFSAKTGPSSLSLERQEVMRRFILDAWRRIQADFGPHIDTLCGRDTSLGLLLRAILIYENVNRPAWVRLLERAIVRVPGVRLTVGIAQVMSKCPLSDTDSITKAYELLTEENGHLQDLDHSRDDYSRIERLIRIYNPSEKYHKEVLSVYRLIASEHGSLIASKEDKRGN